ncbi:MAG: VanW family protein [bacterium]|nr:VanW family protein [bacterium]
MFGIKSRKQKKENKQIQKATPIVVLIILLLLGTSIITFVFLFNSKYDGQVYPGTKISGVDVGGMNYDDLHDYLVDVTNQIKDKGINIEYQDQKINLKSTVGDLVNPELTSELFSYDIDETIDLISSIITQRSEAENIYYWMVGWEMTPILKVDSRALIESLEEQLSEYEQPAINAALQVSEELKFTIGTEKGGQAFDYSKIINNISKNLLALSNVATKVELEIDNPEITKVSAEPALSLVQQVFDAAPYTLIFEEMSWEIDQMMVRDWIVFVLVDGKVSVGFDHEKVTNYIEAVANEINVEVKEAKFKMENGRVLEFQPSRDGRVTQVEATVDLLNEKIRQVGINEIDVLVEIEEPNTETSELNNMGIKELIGEGRSNFAGSPANRRHNIAVGSDSLNGLLIAPGETFSLVGALGKIEASTGYLPELVIKGNKTIPEYGGGLCQVGTTTFRAVLDAGLKIIERKNHSYRVSYYEPAGTDATIYDPAPDFKFINDTENYILFTTEISGNELIYRIYGTNDGRKVEQTYPKIYNLVSPGPTKLIETTDLAPGQKKCTESAHAGADAEFTRTITYADGTQNVDVYKSHYKPWQAVCLIGVEELSAEEE